MARLTGAVYLSYFVIAFGTGIIQGHAPETIVRFGNILGYAIYSVVTLLFYNLFKPVSKRLSMAAVVVSLAGCVMGVLGAFHPASHQVNLLYFFGPYCLLLGILILGSKFLPGILGGLMMLAGLGWLVYLIPGVARHMAVSVGVEALGVAAEGILMLWLLIMGVNEQQWQKQARQEPKAKD